MAGFDCLWLDMEHVANDYATIEHGIWAAKSRDTDVLVRVPRGSYSDLVRPLELDAAGIMVPHVMSLADAKARAKEAATAKFRAVRAGGTTINGALISTDQNALVELSEVVALLDGTSDTLNAVTRSGSTLSLDYDTAVALRGAVQAHYKAAVAREAALYAAIDDAEDLTALRNIGLNSGWPK